MLGEINAALSAVHSVFKIVLLALIYILAVRPLLGWIAQMEISVRSGRPIARASPPPPGAETPGAPGAEFLPPAAEFPSPAKTPGEIEEEEAQKVIDAVYEFVSESPGKTADLLRSWVKEG